MPTSFMEVPPTTRASGDALPWERSSAAEGTKVKGVSEMAVRALGDDFTRHFLLLSSHLINCIWTLFPPSRSKLDLAS